MEDKQQPESNHLVEISKTNDAKLEESVITVDNKPNLANIYISEKDKLEGKGNQPQYSRNVSDNFL